MEIHSQIELMEVIGQMGFLPLLDSGIRGFSAEEMVDDDSAMWYMPTAGGTGRCGNGKGP